MPKLNRLYAVYTRSLFLCQLYLSKAGSVFGFCCFKYSELVSNKLPFQQLSNPKDFKVYTHFQRPFGGIQAPELQIAKGPVLLPYDLCSSW